MSLLAQVKSRLTLVILPLALTACGGGSSGGNSFSADDPISISEANARVVVAEAADASVGSGLDSPLSSAFRAADQQQAAELQASRLLGIVMSQMTNGLGQHASRSREISDTETVSCAISGTITSTYTVDINYDTGNGSVEGKTVADNCSDVAGEFIDGEFTLTGRVRNLNQLEDTITADFDDFTVRNPDGSGSIDGRMRITVAERTGYSEFSMVSRGCAFSFSAGGQTVAIGNFSFIIKDYFSYVEEDIDFTANSSQLGGSFQFETVVPFRTETSDVYPSSGQAIITGAENRKIRMTSLGGQPSDLVRIELDLDGDGIFEREILPAPTWAEVDGS